MPALALWVLAALPAAPSFAVNWVQGNWQGGAVSGSTTSLTTGWGQYDSQDGNIVVLSTGLQSQQRAGSWTQNDNSVSTAGFSYPGSSFSNTQVVGSGPSAFVELLYNDTISNQSATIPRQRSAMAISTFPTTGKIYLFGGLNNDDGTLSNQILQYDPLTDTISAMPTVLPSSADFISAVYHPGKNKIYLFGGYNGCAQPCGSNQIWEYDPVGGTIVAKTTTLPTGRYAGAAAYHPSTNKIYYFGGTQGGVLSDLTQNTTYYDQILAYDPVTDTISTMPTRITGGCAYFSASYASATNTIYLTAGYQNTADCGYSAYDPVGNTLSLASGLLVTSQLDAAAYHAGSGKLLIFGGQPSSSIGGPGVNTVVRYDPLTGAVVGSFVLPSVFHNDPAAYFSQTDSIFIFGSSSNYTNILKYAAGSTGTYVSAVFDTANQSGLNIISWNPVTQSTTAVALTIGLRAGNTPTPDASWSNGGIFATVTNGGSITSFGPSRYVQYIATFTTTAISSSPVLNDITISYSNYVQSTTLVSSSFNSGGPLNVIQNISWQATLPAGTSAQFQIRTASDNGSGFPGTWSPWLGPTSGSDYYTSPTGAQSINPTHSDGVADQWFQYKAVLLSSNVFATPTLSTVTITYNLMPVAPSLTSLTANTSTQLTASWTDNSNNEDEFVLSSGTASGATNLGVATPTASKIGTGGTQSATIPGLSPNTTYYVRVRAHALPTVNLYSFYSNEQSLATLAAPPNNLAAPSTYLSSVTLSWNGNGNPSWTTYEISESTDNFTTSFSTPILFSSSLAGATTTVFNLSSATTYYFRTRAQNSAGIPTTFSNAFSTVTLPGVIGPPIAVSLGISSIAWNWTNSAGPAVQSFNVYSASNGAVLANTVATNFNEVGLSTNAVYGIAVAAVDASGVGPLSPTTTAFTRAAPPVGLNVAAVYGSSAAVSWNANGNPAGTPFEVSVSTDNFALNVSTPVPFAANLTAATTSLFNLAAGTTYYFRLRAQNLAGVASAPSNVVSTVTLPGALGPPAGAALGVSSISWSWTNTAGPTVQSYNVYSASSALLLANVPATSFTETALAADIAYGIAVAPVNGSGTGPLSAPATVYTLAAAPSSTALAAVYLSSLTVSWSPNGDPAGTVFEIRRATDGVSFALISSQTATSFTDTQLGNATYYYKIRALNGDNIATAYDTTISTFMAGQAPGPPNGLTLTNPSGTLVTLSWNSSPGPNVLQYDIYWDSGTGAVNYGVTYTTVPASTTSYTTGPLSPGTYYFAVRAKNQIFLEERNTSVLASITLVSSAPFANWTQAQILFPRSGKVVWGNRVGLYAALVRGTASGTSQVLFQYRAAGSTTAPWIAVTATESNNPVTTPPFYVHWDVTAFAAGTYEVRAAASNLAGQADPNPPSTLIATNPSNPDIQENMIGGSLQHLETISNSVSNTAFLGSLAGAQILLVTLPAGALGVTSSTVLQAMSPASPLPAISSNLSATGISLQLTLQNGQTALSVPATLTASYIDDNNGLVAGTLARVDRLAFMVYQPAMGKWQLESPATVDAVNKTVTAQTPHFSVFGVFAPAAVDLSTARAYPVPYRPNGGNPDQGKPFNAADPTSGIIFDNLTQSARIQIFDASAELVWQTSSASTSGKVQWNAKNSRGQDVATGGYIAVIRDLATGQTVVKKLAIIRY